MNRRDFMTRFAALGGTVIPAWILPTEAAAQAGGFYDGKVLFNIRLDGGPAHTLWSDYRNAASPGIGAVEVGPFRFGNLGSNQAFVTRFAPNMLVINGINSLTNGHDEGNRSQNSGRLDMGYPAIGELFANQVGKSLPLAYLNQGSAFAQSVGLRAPTPVPQDTNAIRAMVSPNAASATNDFVKQADLDKVFAARAERERARQAAATSIPRMDFASRQILGSDASRALLAQVASFIPAQLDANFQTYHMGLIAAQAGVTSVVQTSSGGWDNHGDVNNNMVGPLNRISQIVNYIVDKAGTMGIANRIIIRLYGEFGRTPIGNNNGNGKDHYSGGGTCVIIEPGVAHNRVVGMTGPNGNPIKINLQGKEDPAGFNLTVAHLHVALRKYLGITQIDSRFDLKVPVAEQIDLFNPAVTTGMPYL
jgi:hypothetical protein